MSSMCYESYELESNRYELTSSSFIHSSELNKVDKQREISKRATSQNIHSSRKELAWRMLLGDLCSEFPHQLCSHHGSHPIDGVALRVELHDIGSNNIGLEIMEDVEYIAE